MNKSFILLCTVLLLSPACSKIDREDNLRAGLTFDLK